MSFILSDSEYLTAKREFTKQSSQVIKQSQKYKRDGISRKERKRLISSDMRRLKAARKDLAVYEQLKEGKLPKLFEFVGLGQQLVCLRIAHGLTQVDLAALLGQEARKIQSDEQTAYQNVTVAYMQRVMAALNAKVRLSAKPPKKSKKQ